MHVGITPLHQHQRIQLAWIMPPLTTLVPGKLPV